MSGLSDERSETDIEANDVDQISGEPKQLSCDQPNVRVARQKKSCRSAITACAFSIKTVKATPRIMPTSVSSISTTIGSNSERAAENFMAVAPRDKVDSIETMLRDSRQVRPSSHHRSIARGKVHLEQQRSPRKIFRLRRKRPRRWQEARVVCVRSARRRALKVEQPAAHRAVRHRDELQTTRPVRLTAEQNLAVKKRSLSTSRERSNLGPRNARPDQVCRRFRSD